MFVVIRFDYDLFRYQPTAKDNFQPENKFFLGVKTPQFTIFAQRTITAPGMSPQLSPQVPGGHCTRGPPARLNQAGERHSLVKGHFLLSETPATRVLLYSG